MSLPRYPKYKDSGVEWLREVPEHWELRRVGHCFAERREKVSDRDFPALSVTKNGIVPQLETAAKSDDGDNRKRVCEGDFVINSRSDRKGSAGTSVLRGSVSLICTVLQPKHGVHGSFVHHLLTCQSFQEEFYRNGKGIVADLWSTNFGEMRNIILGMPTVAEQDQIAAFLDRETAKIDALVAEQQRLIELLKEKRQAVISHAVTKGLNPDVPMKDSGIEWLGEVPAHWVVARLGYYSTIENGTTPSREEAAFWHDGTVPWIASGEVNQARITEASELITQKALQECSLRLLPAGAVVIGMIGQGKTRGLSAILEINATINQNLAAILTDRRLGSRFLQHVLATGYDYLREFGRGGQQAALNCEILKSLRVPVPPIGEQEDICEHLSRVLPSFDTLTAEAQRAIELLQERRTALISAAVTGQIDVRSSGKRASA